MARFGEYESIPHDRIIAAFLRHVPGSFVRDYRENGGFITICRGLTTIKWGGQTTTTKEERQIPAVTLVNLPRGNVTAMTRFVGLRLDRPGWKQEFRRAARHLTPNQMRSIAKDLGRRGVFPGID